MKTWLIFGVTLAVVACSSSSVEMHANYEPRPSNWPIEVWWGTMVPGDIVNSYPAGRLGQPPRDAIPVATIQVEKYVSSGWDEAIEDARKEARTLGGDGIVVHHQRMSMLGGDTLKILVFRKRGR